MRQIGTFCFDGDTNEFVFGNAENGMRLSNDGVTYIRNGKRISFDELVKEVYTVELVPRVHACWEWRGNDNGYLCSNCGSGCLLNCESDWHKSEYCPHCGALMDLEELDGEPN